MTATSLGTTTYTYGVGASTLSFTIPAFSVSDSSCSVSYLIREAVNTGLSGPYFIAISQPATVGGDPTISVQTSLVANTGTYLLKIRGSLSSNGIPVFSETLTIVVDLCTGVTLATTNVLNI